MVASILVSSCTQPSEQLKLNPLLIDSSNIVSTRAQNTKFFIGVLKLKNPSLLQAAQKINGQAVVDNSLKTIILKEQDEAIAALKVLSSDIQVLYRYKMVLNAIAILAPIELQDQIKAIGQIAYAEKESSFSRPIIMEASNSVAGSTILERNSVKFIGAESLHEKGITGKGIKIGVIDTGIDYTHAMFNGVGTVEAYKSINPSGPAVGFPSKKIVGGIDLVGTEFDSASPEFSKHIPKPDMNPIDEAGHGSHVAGTIAGIGDGIKSYTGVAPDALLHAIKVFGAEGSTSDSVVIAALEYSANPAADGDNSDHLDVVNMSLGSEYGNPHILYSEAVKNLVRGGTVVIASGGNSGHQDYIVGAPGTSEEALSVAASVDNSDQNWKFNSSKIIIGTQTLLVEAIEAATTKKIAVAGAVSGKLVYVGAAASDFTPEQKAAVTGNVALVDRGQVAFNDKIKRSVDAGAIGVVVVNNQPDAAFLMGTKDDFAIPAIMISLEVGNKIKEAMKTMDAMIQFQSVEKIEKPELIDTLTSFTSKGPRSFDGLIKPEISAPGNNVISVKMGSGNDVVQFSGTSMAAPHMTGVVALVKQAQTDLSAEEIKNILMGTAKTISEKGERYTVTLQGSGRVQADKAAFSQVVAEEPAFSLGETGIEIKKSIRKVVHLKNLSTTDMNLSMAFEGNNFITMASSSVLVKAKASIEIPLLLNLDATKMKEETIREMDGWIKFSNGTKEVYRIPVLAIAHRLAAIQATQLVVQATSARDAAGAAATVEISNANGNAGQVLLFNSLGDGERKPFAENYMSAECNLQTAGYRIATKKNSKGEDEDILQVAVKTYKPVTTWNTCDISLLIFASNNVVPDQELLGANLKTIPGEKSTAFASTLIDAAKARSLRKEFEAKIELAKNDSKKLLQLKDEEKYDEALIDQRPITLFNNSTVAVVEAAISNLAKTAAGNLTFKLVVTHNDNSSVKMDDYLGGGAAHSISLNKADQSFVGLPESISMGALEVKKIDLTKGSGSESLLVLMPQNKFSFSDLATDSQEQVLNPSFK